MFFVEHKGVDTRRVAEAAVELFRPRGEIIIEGPFSSGDANGGVVEIVDIVTPSRDKAFQGATQLGGVMRDGQGKFIVHMNATHQMGIKSPEQIAALNRRLEALVTRRILDHNKRLVPRALELVRGTADIGSYLLMQLRRSSPHR